MASNVDFKLKGAEELNAALKELGPTVATKLRTPALRAGAAPVVKEAKRLVPVRSGALKKSITVRTIRNVSFVPGKGLRTAGPSRVVIGFLRPASRHAHLVEFGTSKMAAEPFMRPALASQAAAAFKAMAESLARGIAREAAKLAKKA